MNPPGLMVLFAGRLRASGLRRNMKRIRYPSNVMPGLVPGIHVFAALKGVDGRNKSGHDVLRG
jgi:hypothetical protein